VDQAAVVIVEAALAHVVRNAAEAAYARTDLLDRRRKVMEDWAEVHRGVASRLHSSRARPALSKFSRHPPDGGPVPVAVAGGPDPDFGDAPADRVRNGARLRGPARFPTVHRGDQWKSAPSLMRPAKCCERRMRIRSVRSVTIMLP